MADRIDHAARSAALLDSFSTSVAGAQTATAGMNIEEVAAWQHSMLMVLTRASVEANLALVEQQRIANLIALSESGRATVNGARAALSALYVAGDEGGSASMAVLPDIAAALGIEAAS